jgi:hypothetical protein
MLQNLSLSIGFALAKVIQAIGSIFFDALLEIEFYLSSNSWIQKIHLHIKNLY